MDELTANISFDRFADMPEFYGSGAAEYRLAMVKERDDFLDLFEGARHVDAVTYAETPELMMKMLTEYDISSLDVLIGNAEDYADQVNEVPTARSLVQLRQDDRLTVRLKNRKTVHSKIYRIVMPDDTVKLVQGSANLSRNSWEYHTNQISVITTDVGTELDEEFERFIDEYREGYSDQTLLEGLVEALEEADSPEERENRIGYWVGAGDLDVSDTAALNQDAVEELKQVPTKSPLSLTTLKKPTRRWRSSKTPKVPITTLSNQTSPQLRKALTPLRTKTSHPTLAWLSQITRWG